MTPTLVTWQKPSDRHSASPIAATKTTRLKVVADIVNPVLPVTSVVSGVETSLETPFLVMIDRTVDDIPTLLEGIRPGGTAILLDPNRDGIEQITEALRSHSGITALHLISHGAPGQIFLGSSVLSAETLPRYAAHLQSWQQFLVDDAELLIYGCNVAENSASFLHEVHRLTGISLAASTTLTGSVSKGGDWNLDARFGNGRGILAIAHEAIERYTSLLIVDILINSGSGDGAADGTATFAGSPSGVTGQVQPTDTSATNTFNIFESELEGLSAATNILLRVNGNITVPNIADNTIALQTLGGGGGGSINLIANSDGIAPGTFVMNDANDQINALGRVLNIAGAGIITGGLNTLSQVGGGNAGNGGEIALNASGNITTTDINSISAVFGDGNTGNGGAITLNAAGNITGTIIESYSASNTNVTNGGAIALNTSGNITSATLQSVSASNAVVSGNGSAANGGAIALNGTNINITANIFTYSATGNGTVGNRFSRDRRWLQSNYDWEK